MLGVLLVAVAGARDAPALDYPSARRGDQMDDYHGTAVADPYRWLEDIDSPETRAWVAAQGMLSRRFLDAIPGRESMTRRLRDLWNFERWTPPVRHGANWFYTHNDGLQNQSTVFVMSAAEMNEPAAAAGDTRPMNHVSVELSTACTALFTMNGSASVPSARQSRRGLPSRPSVWPGSGCRVLAMRTA